MLKTVNKVRDDDDVEPEDAEVGQSCFSFSTTRAEVGHAHQKATFKVWLSYAKQLFLDFVR